MSARLAVTFSEGTHRSVAPAATLSRVAPFLAEMGITRTADITGLDRLGIPTWIAVRPKARLVQVSNGKGVSPLASKVGAIMEAIEHWHAETPAGELCQDSTAELEQRREAYVPPAVLPGYRADVHLTARRRLAWVQGEDLAGGTPIWVPASAVFEMSPTFFRWSTNGLASGNHVIEATLHALYELIERDAMKRLTQGGVSLPWGDSRVVDLDTVPSGLVAMLRDRLRRAGVTLVLVRVASVAPVVTFWAVLVDPASVLACSSVNLGHGSHLNSTVAAVRAITEAAQTRLTYIHGSREDLSPASYEFDAAHQRLRSFFERQRGDLAWVDIADHATGDLARDLQAVTQGLDAAGFPRIYRVDLTRPRFSIPVVRMLVPGLAE